MKLTSLLCIVLVVLTSATVETPFEKIINGFNRYTLEQPQEKIYVHIDRSQYFSGETIWLKSYLTEGPNHEASQLSSTIYVELINESGKIVEQIKQHVQNGSAAGSIILPDTVRAGNYVVRAYTNWMRNFSDDYFFYRSITISDYNDIASKEDDRKNVISLQFFPEGGDLVNGIGSRVGFKAIDENGLARVVQGKIIDDQGNFITAFKSNVLGMGACMLTPESGKAYKAVVDGITDPFTLPEVKKSGVTLSVINLPGQDKVTLRIQTVSYQEDQVYLLVQSRGVVSFSPALTITSNNIITKLDKAELPEGITQITVLNKAGQPLCERLIYIEKPEKQLNISLTSDKEVYKPREKITMTIDVRDLKNNPVAANLSLAVNDDRQNPYDVYRESMHAYLTLRSDLKGHIESPGYYFDKQNPDRHMALDWLLMTQGWRRFTVEEALHYDARKLIYPSEQGITVKGTMVDKYSKKPMPEGKVTYLGLGSILNHQETITDASGKFELRNIIFYDSSKLVLQGETKKGKRWTSFVMDSSLISPAVNFTFPDQRTANELNQTEQVLNASDRKAYETEYNFDENAVVFKELVVKAKRDTIYPNRAFGQAPITVVVEGNKSLENLTHPMQLLQGRHAGVLVTGSPLGGGGFFILIRGQGSITGSNQPLILLDNIPSGTNLGGTPVRDIASYDLWKGPEAAIFGMYGANGVIAFYTKRGKSQPYKIEGMYKFNNGGYTVGREFYSPEYDVDSEINLPDKRATLFWAPTIQTDSVTGRATVSFYNHDVVTSVTGTIEGITLKGNAGSAIYRYEIKRD